MIRIGVLTPHELAGPELEFAAMAPGRLATSVARVAGTAGAGGSGGATSPADLAALAAVCEWTSRHVEDAAQAVFIGGNGFRAADDHGLRPG